MGALHILTAGDRTKESTVRPAIEAPRVVDILRIQVPKTRNYVTRVTFLVTLKKNSSLKCCQQELKSRIQWIKVEDATVGNIQGLYGPEVITFMAYLKQQQVKETFTNFVELTLIWFFQIKPQITECSLEDELKFAPHDKPANKEQELIRSAGFHERDINKLYQDFIQFCYPSQFLTSVSFADYMVKLGFPSDNRINPEFRAFGYLNKGKERDFLSC